MHCVAWTPVSLRSTTANWISVLPRHRSLEKRNPARKTHRSCRDSCYRTLSSRTARTKGSSTTGQAGESSEQIRLASLARNCGERMHDPSQFESSLLFLGAVCANSSKAQERSSAQRPLSVPALLDDSRWQPDVPWYGSSGRADSPCSERTDSIHDSEPDLWKWDMGAAGDHCHRVTRPIPQSAATFRPRLLLRELVLVHSPSDPRCSIRGSPLTISDWRSLRRVAHTECVIIMFQATVNN